MQYSHTRQHLEAKHLGRRGGDSGSRKMDLDPAPVRSSLDRYGERKK